MTKHKMVAIAWASTTIIINPHWSLSLVVMNKKRLEKNEIFI
jgi:hypothetical protein